MATPTPTELAAFLGRSIDSTQAASVIQVVTSLARNYTRGAGFTDDGPIEDVAAVIMTCSARVLSHPRQVGIDEAEGPASVRYMSTPVAFTVGERQALNRWRIRSL